MDPKTALRVIHLLKHSDIEMIQIAITSFDYSGFTHAGSYQRGVDTIENGMQKSYTVTIPRLRIRGSMSKHTISVLPDILIKYHSRSIRFIMTVLFYFYNRKKDVTVDEFCSRWFFNKATLYKWNRLFRQNSVSWARSLLSAEELCQPQDTCHRFHDTLAAPLSYPGAPIPFSMLEPASVLSSDRNDHSRPGNRTQPSTKENQ